MEDSKVIFITHPYYAINNPSNNFRIYKKAKNSDHWTYIQCKDKNEYRAKIKEYIGGFLEYGRNEEKAYTSIKEYTSDKNSSLFDYFMGGKKDDKIMFENQMKREEMAMIKNGTFLLDKDVSAIQKRWSNYIENSNIQLAVLSFNQNYIDENISIKELQKKITTEVMPKFLSYCGYENPKDNLEWVVALHNDRENNYHFHISWVEKKKCYINRENKSEHRMKLKLSDNEINFLKRQSILTIERKKLYTPALIKLENDLEDIKSYFNPKDKNFTLKNLTDLKLEENIIKLGFLLNQVRATNKKYIKYNSLPKNDIGNEIRRITILIKNELFKDEKIKNSKKEINNSIDKINKILLDIDKRNNISDIGFESALNNVMIQKKLEKNENYILNAIANHALYNFEFQKRKNKTNNLTIEDLINQIAYDNYMRDFYNINKVRRVRIKLVKNFLLGKTYKSKIINALDRLGYEQDRVAEQFYEMLSNDNEKSI